MLRLSHGVGGEYETAQHSLACNRLAPVRVSTDSTVTECVNAHSE